MLFNLLRVKLLAFQIMVSALALSQNTITGTIYDQSTRQPIEFAQIALIQPSDSLLVTGGLTNQYGRFEIHTGSSGNYLMRIGYIGYTEKWKNIQIISENNYLGRGYLAPSTTALGEVQMMPLASGAGLLGSHKL
ncbi:carboxypeptidase-like regulatory domain-containing protein [Alkaliflexus imshenetskii]|uniref:carboxypeptidase-like regulatory domain-containing protein n=1 Tax=Alkaliflexus imshenetskii TaxID=286730 RepID=UPI00047EC53E|nr:carboxypeptidase-like regulatory domain-containing protein [Alkaliflexus imshenetskii]